MAAQYDNIIEAISAALPAGKNTYQLSEPVFDGNEITYLADCIKTGWVSSVGAYVSRFENMLAEFTDAKYVVATSCGTAALHAALIVAGVSRDDEVLVPAISFVATANAVAYCNAFPHFVDCSETTLGVDPVKLDEYLASILILDADRAINKNTGRTIRALIVVHAFGHPADLDEIADICEKYRLILLEDAAEAIGSYYKDRHVGNHGLMSVLSFNGNKIITAGGGGAVLCNDEQIAKRLRHLTTTAKTSHPWRFEHDEVGYNYRLPNINAAIGCAQLEKISERLSARRQQAMRYKTQFESLDNVHFIEEPEFTRSNYWLSTIELIESTQELQDEFIERARDKGFMLRPVWRLLNKLPMYSTCPAMDLQIAEKMEYALVNLPSN